MYFVSFDRVHVKYTFMILYFILVKYGIQVLLPWLQGTCIHLFVPTKSFASDDWKSLGINPNIVVCEDIGLKILFAMYNHHNLAKENRSEQEILVAGLLRTTNNFSRNYHTKMSIYRESEQHYPCTSATVLDIQRINS